MPLTSPSSRGVERAQQLAARAEEGGKRHGRLRHAHDGGQRWPGAPWPRPGRRLPMRAGRARAQHPSSAGRPRAGRPRPRRPRAGQACAVGRRTLTGLDQRPAPDEDAPAARRRPGGLRRRRPATTASRGRRARRAARSRITPATTHSPSPTWMARTPSSRTGSNCGSSGADMPTTLTRVPGAPSQRSAATAVIATSPSSTARVRNRGPAGPSIRTVAGPGRPRNGRRTHRSGRPRDRRPGTSRWRTPRTRSPWDRRSA